MAGQTGSSGHLTIHKNAIVWAQSGVGHDVPEGAIVSVLVNLRLARRDTVSADADIGVLR
jgi:UDP-3-O-[3-hydroxymyristoyl] glucosamine N-acyltransferase